MHNSCWQLYRQSLSRTPLLTEHINKRLTFSLFIIQSKEKQRKSIGLFDQYQDYFFDLKLKI